MSLPCTGLDLVQTQTKFQYWKTHSNKEIPVFEQIKRKKKTTEEHLTLELSLM